MRRLRRARRAPPRRPRRRARARATAAIPASGAISSGSVAWPLPARWKTTRTTPASRTSATARRPIAAMTANAATNAIAKQVTFGDERRPEDDRRRRAGETTSASTTRPLTGPEQRQHADHRERGGDRTNLATRDGLASSAAIRGTCSRTTGGRTELDEEPEPAEPDGEIVHRADHGNEVGHDVDRREEIDADQHQQRLRQHATRGGRGRDASRAARSSAGAEPAARPRPVKR